MESVLRPVNARLRARFRATNIMLIPISLIRRDGGAQHRIAPNPQTVKEYARLMQEGVEFPPIPVRFDGSYYWPSDGFQRIGAAELCELVEIECDVRPGTKEDAQWDSYAANATHGSRRTARETTRVIQLALRHPDSARLSTVQLAKHLHVPESTVRYWRERLSSQLAKMPFREVTRGGTTYRLNIGELGKNGDRQRVTMRALRDDLTAMKDTAKEGSKCLLAIIDKWMRGQIEATRCVVLIDTFLNTYSRRAPDDRVPSSGVLSSIHESPAIVGSRNEVKTRGGMQ